VTDYKKLFKDTLNEVIKLRNKKQKAYGDDWVDIGLTGNYYNIQRKFKRLETHFQKGNKLEFENIEDTYKDLIVYATFGLMLIRKETERD